MRLQHLWISDYKNLRNCEVEFAATPLLTAIIGGNGSGKSNLIEAVLHILIGCYFKEAPPFDFRFQYEAHGRTVCLRGEGGEVSATVDGHAVSRTRFAERLRDGAGQVYYPEVTLAYYSGECDRLRRLLARYEQHLLARSRKVVSEALPPLFVAASNERSEVVLLALFGHRKHGFLDRLGVRRITQVSVTVASPEAFDSSQDEPRLWGTQGAIQRILAALDGTATLSTSKRRRQASSVADDDRYAEIRTYHFADRGDQHALFGLADRLAKDGDNIYLAFEQLRVRGIFRGVGYRIAARQRDGLFAFEQLSEGEKQLTAVVGGIQMSNRPEMLVLLDEPDTHLNPHWSWEYTSLLQDAMSQGETSRSAVLMSTHDPIMISGLARNEVLLARPGLTEGVRFSRPRRDPRGQGVANLLCSDEFFGLPSSLDRETQKLLDERVAISVKEELSRDDKRRLRALNEQLAFILPGVSERDPDYVAFLRERRGMQQG